MHPPRAVTVVIPVYNNAEGTLRCVASCKEHVDRRHTILLVNDASTEDSLEERLLAAIEGFSAFRYERNSENLGFVRTCNRAVFELDRTDNDILLLNSDTVVTSGFLEEMLACLYADDTHAACCPRSDDATILTFPCVPELRESIAKAYRYGIWQTYHAALPRYSVLPTGVGFCILIRRSVLREHGLFDEAYGRGYNEENDFCCRLQRHGLRTVAAHHAFVFHELHGSFTSEEREALEQKHSALLLSRYPDYTDRVRSYPPAENVIAEAQMCIRAFQERIAALEKELRWMQRSQSWRVTAPLRWLMDRLRRRPRSTAAIPAHAADTSQAGEVALLRTILPAGGPRILVDVGAYDGEELSNSLPFIREGWEAVVIEPHPASFERLARLHAGNPRVRCVQKACADKAGKLPLYLGAGGQNTMATLCTDDTPWFRANRSDESVLVEVDTLTDILESQHVPAEFPLLLIDAEGMDYEVLLGLDPARYRPRVIVTENYEGDAEKHAAKFALLRDRGYRLHASVGCNTVWVRD